MSRGLKVNRLFLDIKDGGKHASPRNNIDKAVEVRKDSIVVGR